MEITKVELIKPDPESGGTIDNFLVTFNDDSTVELPSNAVGNRHYVEVREWYKAQKKKPFKFDFEG